MIQTQENGKKPNFGPDSDHGHLSSCAISEKANDPILRKLSDGRMDRRTDGQTDETHFIGRCPTNVERPTTKSSRFLMFSGDTERD